MLGRTSFASSSALLLLVSLSGCPDSMATDAGVDAPTTDTVLPVLDAPALDAPGAADAPGGSDAPIADAAPGPDAPVDCAAFNARPEGACDLVLGVIWTGFSCGTMSGCSCVGADCSRLFGDEEACHAAYRMCPRSCGGLTAFGSPRCAADEFCDYPAGSFCGGDDSSGDCTLRPTDCPEPGGVPVCGCDGTNYLNECSANMAGTGILNVGPCPGG